MKLKGIISKIISPVIIAELILIPAIPVKCQVLQLNPYEQNEITSDENLKTLDYRLCSGNARQDTVKQRIIFNKESFEEKPVVSELISIKGSSRFECGGKIFRMGDNGINLKEVMGNNPNLNMMIDEAYSSRRNGYGLVVLAGLIYTGCGIYLNLVDIKAKSEDPFNPDYEEAISVPALLGVFAIIGVGTVVGITGFRKINSFDDRLKEVADKYNESLTVTF